MLPLQNDSRFLHQKWKGLPFPFYDSLVVDLVWKRAFLEGEKSLPHHILPQSTNWRSFSAHYLMRQQFALLKFRKKQWLVIYYSFSPKSSAIYVSLNAWRKLRKNWQIQSFFSCDKKVTKIDQPTSSNDKKWEKVLALGSSWSRQEPVIEQLTSVAFFSSVIDGNKQPHIMLPIETYISSRAVSYEIWRGGH